MKLGILIENVQSKAKHESQETNPTRKEHGKAKPNSKYLFKRPPSLRAKKYCENTGSDTRDPNDCCHILSSLYVDANVGNGRL